MLGLMCTGVRASGVSKAKRMLCSQQVTHAVQALASNLQTTGAAEPNRRVSIFTQKTFKRQFPKVVVSKVATRGSAPGPERFKRLNRFSSGNSRCETTLCWRRRQGSGGAPTEVLCMAA